MHLSGCIEQIGMHKKLSQVFSVGPKTPVNPGTSLSNGILPQCLKFSFIFMNMQMRYFHIGPLDERTDQIVSLMCINGDIKSYCNGGVIMVWG